MLHLDQNHSSLSPPHSKSNLILSSSPRLDQPSLLSWPSATRDDRAFCQEQSPLEKPDTAPAPKQDPQQATTASAGPDTADPLGNTTPGNAEDPKQPDPSSTSTTDPTSPTSSLTPPPDTTSPAFPSSELPDGESATQLKVDGTEGEVRVKVEANTEVEKASRASTPLSELSSAPDADEPPDGDRKAANEDAPGATSAKRADGAKTGAEHAEGKLSGEGEPLIQGHSENDTFSTVTSYGGIRSSSATSFSYAQDRVSVWLKSTFAQHC